MSELRLITTSDGSHSLLNTQLNETYHSTHGAIQESVHVFINNGLDFLIKRNTPSEVHILEIGFGTGLNALLTLQKKLNSPVKIFYTTLEAYPLPEEVWLNLNYAAVLEATEYFSQLHRAEWETWQEIIPDFYLRKIKSTLQQIDLTASNYDLIYFDAFAPSKQPEMWEYPVLEKVVQQMNRDGVFVTYCAKGQLKRDLKSLALEVETLEGPPGKKEMVRAVLSRRTTSHV